MSPYKIVSPHRAVRNPTIEKPIGLPARAGFHCEGHKMRSATLCIEQQQNAGIPPEKIVECQQACIIKLIKKKEGRGKMRKEGYET